MLSNIKVKSPSIKNTLKEYRIIFELLSSYKHLNLLKTCPKGNKEPVLVIPGFMASDSLTIILRTFLKLLNYKVFGWNLGINLGFSDELKSQLQDLLFKIYKENNNQKINLVSWSLGGIYSRELAKVYPNMVNQVITLGSPFVHPHKGTIVKWAYEIITGDNVNSFCDNERINRLLTPPSVRTIAIYSKYDGIADESSCKNLDYFCNDLVFNIEVDGTHIGMTSNYKISKIIAEVLTYK